MKEEILEQIKAYVEPLIENLISEKSDLVIDMLCSKLAEVIPGKFDDVALEAAKPALKQMVKEELLKQADKISERV